MDNALCDDDIIDLSLNIDIKPENDDKVEEIPVFITTNIVREDLQLCSELENNLFFMIRILNAHLRFNVPSKIVFLGIRNYIDN